MLPKEIRDLDARSRRIVVGIAIAGCLLRLFFWHYTHRTWEDALISVLHSENVRLGFGLTHHHPGYRPLHGFTSPLSVLVPLTADIFHPGWGLIFLKIVSALISIPTVLLAAAIALNRAFFASIWLVYMLCAYLAFEHHQILWGMAGMESQIAVFVLFLTMYQALKLNTVGLGISMALCLYARPDFAIFLLVVALYLFVTDRSILMKSAGLGAALYAPWLLFTTWYYGSPVPNTILAKSMGYGLWTAQIEPFSARFFDVAWGRFFDGIFLPLGPSFAGHGTGYLKFFDGGFLSRVALMALLIGIAGMIGRFNRFYILPVGFLVGYSLYYIFFVQAIFGWYLVPFSAVNCLTLVLGLSALLKTFALPLKTTPLARTACFIFIVPLLAVLPVTFRTEREINGYIENPVRKAIGRYLFTHKRPGDVVACEPLGFIGYYSRMPVLDFPGLASPEVSAFLKSHPDSRKLDRMLEAMRPEWIALREMEYQSFITRPYMKFLETDYTIEKVFRSDAGHTKDTFGISHNVDTAFYLLKRRDNSTASSEK